MSERPIDIDALRLEATRQDAGENAVVSRRWLASVEEELRKGRVALATLAGRSLVDQVCQSLQAGAPR